jgi:hypothetical protein
MPNNKAPSGAQQQKTIKSDLPKGKITARLRTSRGVYQCYAGRHYLSGCAGSTVEEAIELLKLFYNIPANTKLTIHGHSSQSVTYIN